MNILIGMKTTSKNCCHPFVKRLIGDERTVFWFLHTGMKSIININNNLPLTIAFLAILLIAMTGCSVKNASGDIAIEEEVFDVVNNNVPATENPSVNNPIDDNDNNDGAFETVIKLYLSVDEGLTRFEIFYENEGMSRYEPYYEYINDEKGYWVIIVPDKTAPGFEFIKVGDYIIDDHLILCLDYVVHPVGEITPEKPFLVKTYTHWGERPGYGVAYFDSNNVKRYFYLFQSMMDHDDDDDSEGFRLIEFTDTPPPE